MSMPVSFLPAAPVSPAGPNAAVQQVRARRRGALRRGPRRPHSPSRRRGAAEAPFRREGREGRQGPQATRNTKDTKDPKAARNPKDARRVAATLRGGVAAGSAVGSRRRSRPGPSGPCHRTPTRESPPRRPSSRPPHGFRGRSAPPLPARCPHWKRPSQRPLWTSDVTPSTVDAPVAAAPGDTRAGAGDTGAEDGHRSSAGRYRPRSRRRTARVDAPASTAPASQPAPAPQAPPLPPAAQIALKLAPLRVGPDGSAPDDHPPQPRRAGPDQRRGNRSRADELSVQLTGTTAGADAVKAALPQLEQQLRDGGFNTVARRRSGGAAHPRRPTVRRGPVGPGGRERNRQRNVRDRTTTSGAKTESQPIGQAHQPDGTRHPPHRPTRPRSPPACTTRPASRSPRRARRRPATRPDSTASTTPASNQAGNQLNFGQPGGNQPDPSGRYGTADQDNHGGRHGTAHNEGGAERLPGRPDGRRARTAHRRTAGRPPTGPRPARSTCASDPHTKGHHSR
jgi:hypothetical protein